MNMHHLALRVIDPDASAGFYVGLLGLRELSRHVGADGRPRAVWLALGDAVLMLERSLLPSGPSSGSAHVLVLGVDDLGVWEAKLAAAGVTIVERTAFTLYLHDPDGHRLGLSTFRFAGL